LQHNSGYIQRIEDCFPENFGKFLRSVRARAEKRRFSGCALLASWKSYTGTPMVGLPMESEGEFRWCLGGRGQSDIKNRNWGTPNPRKI